jgi:hypothetical protein
MQKPSVIALAGGLLVLAGIALLLSGVSPGSDSRFAGSPPVEIDYANSGLVYQGGLYFDRIAIRNYGSPLVSVIVSIKTGLDYSPRSSTPVQVCPGCSVNVLIKEIQPDPTQTAEQKAQMVNFMTHPESLKVYYSSSPTAETNVPTALAGIVMILAGVALFVYSRRGTRSQPTLSSLDSFIENGRSSSVRARRGRIKWKSTPKMLLLFGIAMVTLPFMVGRSFFGAIEEVGGMQNFLLIELVLGLLFIVPAIIYDLRRK